MESTEQQTGRRHNYLMLISIRILKREIVGNGIIALRFVQFARFQPIQLVDRPRTLH
jgi:hypothetical protein